MKNIMYIIITAAIFTISACEKGDMPMEVTLPDEVPFGTTEVYLNGTLMPSYQNTFEYWSGSKTMVFGFLERPSSRYSNSFGFGWLPLREGKYPIGKPGVLYEVATTGFSQIFHQEDDGDEYTLIGPENGYFHITYLDTINKEVKGHFKAIFKRTKKNYIRSGDLPMILLYQGIFYDNYTHH